MDRREGEEKRACFQKEDCGERSFFSRSKSRSEGTLGSAGEKGDGYKPSEDFAQRDRPGGQIFSQTTKKKRVGHYSEGRPPFDFEEKASTRLNGLQ